MFWLGVGLGVVLIVAAGAAMWWWRRRQREPRLVAFVGLLAEPRSFDPAVLASVAGRAWNADLGDGETEGEDGFVVSVGIITTIMHDERMYLLNNFPDPYFDDAEEVAEKVPDLRIRSLLQQHKAWFSCDAMGIERRTPEEEVLAEYRKLAALFAELMDENCLLIYLPDCDRAYPINDETAEALASENPVEALDDTLSLPIIQVADDDPLMQQAVAQARSSWPDFVAAFEAKRGKNFAIKAPVSHSGNTEFIWITVTSFEGERIYGELGNDPGNLGPLKLGSRVSVPLSQLNDWVYVDESENMHGGFTIKAVMKAAKRKP